MHPRNIEFMESVGPVYDDVDAAAGFVGRATEGFQLQDSPRLARTVDDFGRVITTLSTWTDLESARAFSFSGRHVAALGKRREWFSRVGWPPYVVWWVPDGHMPSWCEAQERLFRLADDGESALAFQFGTAFDAEGRRIEKADASR